MPKKEEKFPVYHNESEFSKIRKKKEVEGWVQIGVEKLTQIKFSKDARFLEEPFQTEESIKQKYLEQLKKKYSKFKFEIELMLDENTEKLVNLRKIMDEEEYKEALKNINEEDKNYLVWARKIEK